MQKRMVCAALLSVLVATLSATTMSAQSGSAAVPVIVVLKDDAPFELYRGNYREDERAQANP